MKKKFSFLSSIVILAAVTLCCLFAVPTEAHAASSSGMTFLLNTDGASYSISDCNTSVSGAVELPAVYNGKPVTGIKKSAFSECAKLTSVIIPNSVTTIDEKAFYYCSGLTSITIPDSVISIGEKAFHACYRLTDITIPNSVTSIGSSAFSGCYGLEKMTIPFVGGSRKTLSDTCQYPFGYVFGEISYDGGVATKQSYYGASTSSTTSSTYYIPASLKTVTVTGGTILYGAFSNCTSLTSVALGDSVTGIGKYAFQGCTKLISVTIPGSVKSIGDYAFYNCPSLARIVIPDGVTSIGSYVFCDCTGLISVTIGDSVTSIGNYAFKNCTKLTDVYITDPSAWCKIAFGNYNANPMYYADNLHIIGRSGQEVSEVYLSDTVISIPSNAFRGCSALAFAFIPDSVETIGAAAFANCTGLTSITIPDSVISIGGSVFAGCSSLKEMILPFVGDGNGNYPLGWIFGQAIGNTSYAGFSKITQEYAYSGTVYTGDFFVPDALKSITITGGDIGYGAFSNCTGLTTIAMLTSDSEPYIYDGAFSGCSNLESLTLPNAPTNICRIFGSKSYSGSYAVLQHTECSDYYGSLKTYYLPRSLKNLTITSGRIGECAFDSCYMLENVVLGSGVYAIDAYAFCECANLRSILIPKISYCDADAFHDPFGPNGEDDVQDVWYTGTLSDRENIVYNTYGNKAWFLRNATWHYSTCAYGHAYSSNCDTTCKRCEWVRSTALDHTYDNQCDTVCNVCSDVRTVPHSFDNACDTDCNLCDYIRTIEHSYDHACDTDCNICYEVRSITHTYADATCTAPMTCQICGDTQGKALGPARSGAPVFPCLRQRRPSRYCCPALPGCGRQAQRL